MHGRSPDSSSTPAPLILFGAADRHNFGDLLLARIAEAEADRPVIHAGLASRDLSAVGGVPVVPLGELARAWPAHFGEAPADLLHIGGEILDCDAWSAAVMLCDAAQAEEAIRRLDGRPEAAGWIAQQLAAGLGGPSAGMASPAPYLACRALFARPGRWAVRAAGGVGLAQRPGAFRAAVAEVLRGLANVTVRDAVTQNALATMGVRAAPEVDPVVRLRQHFGAAIDARRAMVTLAELSQRFPHGYAALQFAGEFGDDASLRAVARAVASLPAAWGVVLFRAGAAPWHDSEAVYRRFSDAFLPASGALPGRVVRHFPSLHVLDIAALIAGAQHVLATSLHVGIAAQACAVPFMHLSLGGAADAKWHAWQATWPAVS